MLLTQKHVEKVLFGVSPFDSEHFDAAEWSKGGIYPSPNCIRFHPRVMFACGGSPASVRKGTVSNSYFYVLKSCVLINVTTEGYVGATTVMNQDECVRLCLCFLIHFFDVWMHS